LRPKAVRAIICAFAARMSYQFCKSRKADHRERAVESVECLILLCFNKAHHALQQSMAASMPAMLQPHFWNFLDDNRILAGTAIVRANWGAIAFGSFQSPG
jgi:hypothetical protein